MLFPKPFESIHRNGYKVFSCFIVYVRNIILCCMVCLFTFISLSGLYSFIEICASGMIDGGGMYLMPLFCSSVKLAFIMFL